MAKREPLPAEIHDHFAKANVLHKYVQDDLGEAAKHALETGEYLMAAKLAVPHGSWESECDRLFDGSSRLARSYMQFAKNMSALPKRQTRAILMLEGTLDGAAKAAKNAANPKPPKPEPAEEPDEPIDVDSEPVDQEPDIDEDLGGDDITMVSEPDRAALFQEWAAVIAPVVRLVERIADELNERHGPHYATIQGQLEACSEEAAEWMGVE